MDGKEFRKRIEEFHGPRYGVDEQADGCVNDYGVGVDVCLGGGLNEGGVTIQIRLPGYLELSVRLRPDGTYGVVELGDELVIAEEK